MAPLAWEGFMFAGAKIFPLLEGGVQENNKRGGTENLIGIIGMGVAAELALKDMDARIYHTKTLKEKSARGIAKLH